MLQEMSKYMKPPKARGLIIYKENLAGAKPRRRRPPSCTYAAGRYI